MERHIFMKQRQMKRNIILHKMQYVFVLMLQYCTQIVYTQVFHTIFKYLFNFQLFTMII